MNLMSVLFLSFCACSNLLDMLNDRYSCMLSKLVDVKQRGKKMLCDIHSRSSQALSSLNLKEKAKSLKEMIKIHKAKDYIKDKYNKFTGSAAESSKKLQEDVKIEMDELMQFLESLKRELEKAEGGKAENEKVMKEVEEKVEEERKEEKEEEKEEIILPSQPIRADL